MRSPRAAPAAGPAPVGPATVVGIGASAGGLKALQQFVHAIPADSGMAYVVIVHLDPERQSRLAELLQDRSSIPVSQVDSATRLEGNRIYIIPPAHDLAVEGDTLTLRERGERWDHAPVDLLFRTLAEAFGQDAVGVVLSGTGTDGTAGVRYIRQAGGITVAQSPDESEYEGMPSSAIATGLVDMVLPSSRIPGELVRLNQLPTLENPVQPGADAEAGLARVLATLHDRTGHDFTLYKRSTVLRRLDRRLRFNGVATLDEYLPLLQSSAAECQALLRDLLISVSSFFRDSEAFQALEAMVPALFEGRGAADTVRTWVVGCATGEEVYSLAMVLSEHAATLTDAPRLQLFATDIDEKGYAWARAGLYPAAAVAGIPAERLGRFFTKEAGGYRIAKGLRELVLFAGHNVLHDPPFTRMDLISCRNLFIYLQPEAQERVLETFHFALNPGGTLFLGASETAGESGLFVAAAGLSGPAEGSHRLYTRNAAPLRAARVSAADPKPHGGSAAGPVRSGAPATAEGPGFSYGARHVRMLEQYAPASVIVDGRLEIVHLSAGAGRFLRLNEGEPGSSFLDLTRGELRRVLRTALHQAMRKGARTTRRVRMEVDGAERQVTVHVRPPADDGGHQDRYALILFESAADAPPGLEAGAPHGSDPDVAEELQRTTELLEAASAAHDNTVAELQAVNEELRSINEEQKAATEELETGREEIQSINEELTTINQEHQSTIEELKRTNADLQNLIESTEIGTIFLDRKTRIRRFTPAVTAFFNFVGADQGRSFSDITHRLDYEDLESDVAAVLESLQRIERVVSSDTGKSYIVRINPYRSLDGGNDGVVLTFFDNSGQRRVEEELREAKVIAESANVAKGAFLATLSHEFRTPLNGIIGYADLLQLGGELTESQTVKVERIKAGGWHLVSMIDEILSFAKLDGGHETAEPERLDAIDLARDAAALIEPAAEAKGLGFVLDIPDGALPIITDGGKARQILINLCGNAVKYTFEGEVRLRVVPGDKRVTFEVRDTGIGIAPEHHTRIFERFWQVDGAATRSAGGMGIGLAAAREYARLLRGDVEVESELNRGTTFRLWLPVDYDRR
jgi:two-component system, chemotaxis family, CheB/CheR fusion protein